jgi:hypothetical protein
VRINKIRAPPKKKKKKKKKKKEKRKEMSIMRSRPNHKDFPTCGQL